MKTIHLCVSIRGLLGHTRAEMNRNLKSITNGDGNPFPSVDALMSALMDELAKGREVLPTGLCEGFDYKTGCPGHEVEK